MQANTDPGADPTAPPTPESRRSFSGERYRARWRWDNVVKGTHLLNCWYQLSWDEALTDIADRILDVLVRDGPEAVVFDSNATGLAAATAVHRFAHLLGAITLDLNTEVGDGQQGAAVTFGTPIACRSADDYFYSDMILIWGGNPAYTQIPNFHFLAEARYNGARIIAISPDYNASAIPADRWT